MARTFSYTTTIKVTLQEKPDSNLTEQQLDVFTTSVINNLRLAETEAAQTRAIRGMSAEFLKEGIPIECIKFDMHTEPD